MNPNLVEFLKGWEGPPSLEPRWDRVGAVWDIGYGHVLVPGEPRGRITLTHAVEIMTWDMEVVAEDVDAVLPAFATGFQRDALISFAFNVGATALAQSTLLRRFRAKRYADAADQFLVWCYARGVKVPGLLRRRRAERAIFEGADYSGRP